MLLKNLSVIVPCYNYDKLIKKNIIKLQKKIKEFNISYEIIIINDGSSDNTKIKLEEVKKDVKFVKIINIKKNIGKSHCVKTGIKNSKYNNLILIDCDLPYFKYFNKVLKKLNEEYELVIINRKSIYSKLDKSNLNLYKKLRIVIGNIVGYFNKYFLNLNFADTQAGLKALKKIKKFNRIKFYSKKFFFDLELIFHYQKNNKKIIDIPIKYIVSDESSIKIFSLKNFNILYELIKILWLLKINSFKL